MDIEISGDPSDLLHILNFNSDQSAGLNIAFFPFFFILIVSLFTVGLKASQGLCTKLAWAQKHVPD